MNETAELFKINKKGYSLEIYDDPFNKRIRIDDYYGNITDIFHCAEELMRQRSREKLIIKVRKEHYELFMEKGYFCEAMINDYFLGSNMYFFTKYFHQGRMNNEHWITEDQILNSINGLQISTEVIQPPIDYHLKKVEESDADYLAKLYQTVFEIYPTPLHDPNYIRKTIKEGTIYYSFYHEGEIVSAASAEVNRLYKNAELTDCATLPHHRKHGLMKILLKELESELFNQGIYCSYSIARALSFGMNACLFQLGYVYRGRLKNNVFIYDKLENMNVWVRNLAKEPNFRQ